MAAPEEIRDLVRHMTRMQLIRTCAAWRPDTIAFRGPAVATKIALKSPARRILDLNDEVADLDRLIKPLVAEPSFETEHEHVEEPGIDEYEAKEKGAVACE